MKPTNWSTMISGPGVVSAMPRPSSISPGLQPAVGLDRLLRDVGQHRVGAAEGHHRHLGEEDRDLAEDVRRAERQRAATATGTSQSRSQMPATPQESPTLDGAWAASSHRRAGCRRRPVCRAAPWPPPWNSATRTPPAEIADQAGRRTRSAGTAREEEDRDEGGGRDADHARFFSARRPMRTTACEHDGEHRRLEAEEQRLRRCRPCRRPRRRSSAP